MRLIYAHLEQYLHSRVRSAEKTVYILAPFVRTEALRRLHAQATPGTSWMLIMRWSRQAFLAGASDAGVFPFCRKHGIKLLAHPTIHLKMFVLDESELIAGSANLTDRALGVSAVSNVEFMTNGLSVRRGDLELIARLQREARPVTPEDYALALAAAETAADSRPPPKPKPPSDDAPIRLSQIPSVSTVRELWLAYRSAKPVSPGAKGDLRRFQVPPGLDEAGFVEVVRHEFLRIPILRALTDRLRESDLHFGDLKQWLRSVCEDASGVTAREITAPADRLLNWIEGLGEPRYSVVRPNYSERLRYETDLDQFPLLRAAGVRPTRPEDRR